LSSVYAGADRAIKVAKIEKYGVRGHFDRRIQQPPNTTIINQVDS
jgi:hypothetical protein